MGFDKACVKAGCRGVPQFGFGSLLKGSMHFACAAYRDLLNPPVGLLPGGNGASATPAEGALAASRGVEGREGVDHALPPPPAQGRLL